MRRPSMHFHKRMSSIPTTMYDDETRGLVSMEAMEIGGKLKGCSAPLSRVLDRRWVATTAATSVLFLASAFVHYYRRHVPPTSIVNVQYECPNFVRDAPNVDKAMFDAEYVRDQVNVTQNVTEWLQNFRKEDFDSWGRSYDQVKAGMFHFKQKYFPPNIKSGQSIYESACGIGLNLYMTLEILRDAGIAGLQVYGNEYLPFSAKQANLLFDYAPPAASRKGRICVGDSTELSHVPSNSFDLVYTGYISPLLDPLELGLGNADINFVKYKRLCLAAAKEENAKKLILKGQEKQNNFYGKWVGEMVRIAKPGSAVLVEQVSYPFCEEFLDWGGVNQEWWISGIAHYGWDVDPTSLTFENDTIFRHRYHVFMRKNEA